MRTVTHAGGREQGLLHLFAAWREGAVILAGTGVKPENPAPEDAPVALDCPGPRCRTTVFGESDIEAADRLAIHRKGCHA